MTKEHTLLLKHADYIVSCDHDDLVYEHADLLIRGKEIVSIGPAGSIGSTGGEADDTIDCTGKIIYPGLINTHHHLYQMFSRNLPEVQNLELFDWLVHLYEIWKKLDSEVIYYSSMAGLGELLKTGCTTCFDHHYVFPAGAGTELLDYQFQAAGELGIRMFASRGSMSLSKKDGGLPPDSVVQPVDEILRQSQLAVEAYHDPSRYAMRQVALAPCSPFSVTPDLMIETAKLARALGVRLHTHLAETKDEEEFVRNRFGMRPLAYMESLGWTGSDVWFAHGIHFNDEELDRLAVTGTGIAHCPVSNMKLSSGIARIPEMQKLGVSVGLAVDGSASNDGSNLLEEIRVAYLLHRLNSGSAAPSAYDLLKLATRGSARILGREEIGHLAPGMAADLFMIDGRRLELTGATFDPKALLGTVGYKGSVDCTIVNGEVVVKDGRLCRVDEEAVGYKARNQVRKYLL